jgi:hypothetical protein
MAFHLAPPHRIIGSHGLRVFTPPHCCGPATFFCLQTSPRYSLLLADVQPIFTYYSTFASPGAKDLRIGQAKPIAPPRPPQTPAASSKSPYRKCPGGTHLWTHAAARRRRICDRELRFFANYDSAQARAWEVKPLATSAFPAKVACRAYHKFPILMYRRPTHARREPEMKTRHDT